MLDFISTNVMIGLMAVWSLIISSFWVSFFSTLKDTDFSHMPEGYLLHEKSFVWPDAIIVVLLVASCFLLWTENPVADRLALVAGGMMLFLGVIDVAYEYANDMHKKPRASFPDFMMTCAIVVSAMVIIVRFF